ncbi:probable glutamate--tRNA ligase, mitochondrial [Thrips palmi]|uniref:Nondiscriminating glutamyl-tRNA synthetase EARS2, mitochondrial n=1 Tax=Thrips palmi TaxID=161013 RepID=A0A6P8ZL45_THRPL|nr:probable glutamate--tRNA ligase, mitochondrial [Thrips palmi]
MNSSRMISAFSIKLSRNLSSDVRVRFAPSPTGRLHLGGLRTALYNFLFARANAGNFIIRIEDTDQTRIVPGASEAIESDLLWMGIEPNESPSKGGSYGPYVQSLRLDHYRDNTNRLIENGTAYRCFCSDKRVELLRREAVRRGAVPRYDNRCRSLSSDEIAEKLSTGTTHCIRFKLEAGPDMFEDIVYGKIVLDTASIEGDPVILKSDGFPTYHLACVIDDHLMEISHVLRGVEWQISTSKHLQLYRAFGWKPPQFGHLPLLMNSNGTKLSKRQGDIDVQHFKQTGVFPEVLLSFVTEFGGGFIRERGEATVYTMQDLIKQFNFSSLHTSSCKVDLDRLTRLNRLELDRKLQNPESLKLLCRQLRNLVLEKNNGELSPNSPTLSDANLIRLLQWGLPRMSRLEDFIGDDLKYIWFKPSHTLLLETVKDSPEKFASVLEEASVCIPKVNITDKGSFAEAIKNHCKSVDLNYRSAMKSLRAALCGLKAGPPVAELIDNIGKEEATLRLQLAAQALRKKRLNSDTQLS